MQTSYDRFAEGPTHMKQVVQSLKEGTTFLAEVPPPMVRPGHLLIRTTFTLISAGTEKMLVDFGSAGWISKAMQQPDRVKEVLRKVKKDGLQPTIKAISNKLNQPIPLGYCSAGIVVAVGAGVSGFAKGDRVASNGSHAEMVCVPKHLCALIPPNVSDEEGAFTVAASIALQGIRLVSPTFGETIVVMGLGLIGQLTVRLLLAAGCNVIATDLNEQRCSMATNAGATALSANEPITAQILAATHGIGADAVILTASTKSHQLIKQAAKCSRKRGRIVLVGVVGLQLDRTDFYEKELSFQVSCSYGPGRYDSQYEALGQDYPLPFVRWTEQRNFEAVLQAMANGKLDVKPLISARVKFENVVDTYQHLSASEDIGTLINFDTDSSLSRLITYKHAVMSAGTVHVGLIGAGNFASSTLLPLLKEQKVSLQIISSANGLSAGLAAKQYSISNASADYQDVLLHPDVNLVIITTRHHLHAGITIAALQAGKHVFVEKPLAINDVELEKVTTTAYAANGLLHVGFNRRFAPLAAKAKKLLAGSPDLQIIMHINAGVLPQSHWLNEESIGGGRLVGEACHFIDLAVFLSHSLVDTVFASSSDNGQEFTILLKMKNGAQATIHYFGNGADELPKERIEIHSVGRSMVIENWRRLKGYGFKGFSSQQGIQDKGHARQLALLVKRITDGGKPIIALAELMNVSRATLAAKHSIKEGCSLKITDNQLP